ncbi:MAG: o-succinylbenzoate synthase [Microbacteriaceae bacterium]
MAAAVRSTARVVSIELRNRFRGVNHREALIFEGPNGWAEWSPFLEYEDEEAAIWLRAAVEFAFNPTPLLNRDRIPVNATLGAIAANKVKDALAAFGTFRTVKIKVGGQESSESDDLARVLEVAKLYPEAKIRLDANGSMSVDEALSLVEGLSSEGVTLEYFEQPCQTIGELAEFRIRVKRIDAHLLVAADESVRKVSDPLAVAQASAADILVLKVAPLGGITRAKQIADEAGLPVVVSSAIDTSIGISMGLHLAAALENLEYDCGLGTMAMMLGDVTDNPLVATDGFLDVKRVQVSRARLQELQAQPDRIDWWMQRLERCLALL